MPRNSAAKKRARQKKKNRSPDDTASLPSANTERWQSSSWSSCSSGKKNKGKMEEDRATKRTHVSEGNEDLQRVSKDQDMDRAAGWDDRTRRDFSQGNQDSQAHCMEKDPDDHHKPESDKGHQEQDFDAEETGRDEKKAFASAKAAETESENGQSTQGSDSDSEISGSQHHSAEQLEEDGMETNTRGSHQRQPWRGVPLGSLKHTPSCLAKDLKLEANNQHVILIGTPFHYNKDQLPTPITTSSSASDSHVVLPHCDQSHGRKSDKRWKEITSALKTTIAGPFELEEAILKYNQRYINKWNFTVLHHFFTKHMIGEETKDFFENVCPQLVELALKLPSVCPKPIPYLKKGKSKKLTLSQQQIACLLANAFFCTFPNRGSRTRASGFASYPDINFNNLFQGQPFYNKLEKLRCIINYFRRVLHRMPAGIVTFSRQTLSTGYDWNNSPDSLTKLHVSSTGMIEDDGRGMLQVDFANKYLGGGVLGNGCVQEEIRFVICPEMIISRLFTEGLDDLECLVMTGCERFNDYEGYADTFTWRENHEDQTERDHLGRLCCEVVAIDAQVFNRDKDKQFKSSNILRELNKAYCGFQTNVMEANRSAVCTGNWGCGAFGGDKELKALIQLMAASSAKRDICYFTFGDEQLMNNLHRVHEELCEQSCSVGDVLKLLEDYNRMIVNHYKGTSLFDFILQKLKNRARHNRHTCQWSSSVDPPQPCHKGDRVSQWNEFPDH